MGAPTFRPRLRAAAEWLSFSTLVLGLVLSSSHNVALHWLGLIAMTGGAFIAWFSHLGMRSELERAAADAQAWRCWQHASEDVLVVLGAPRDGWPGWKPGQDDASRPVILSTNRSGRRATDQGSDPAPAAGWTFESLWSPDALPPLLDTIREVVMTMRAQPGSTNAERPASEAIVQTREVAVNVHDQTQARWWLHRVVACGDRLIVQTQDITAIRAAQRERQERETFYRTLVDSLPMGIFARSTRPRTAGQYLVWNGHLSEVLRVPAERILGTKGDHVLPESWLVQGNEQDLQVLRDPRQHRFEGLSFQTAEGERIVDMIKTPVYGADGDIDHILVIANDVTEQRRAAEQLRLASQVIDETGDAVVVSDAVDRIVMVNPAFLRLTGLTRDAVVGQSAELLGLTPLRDSHLAGVSQAIQAGERWSGESTQPCRDGRQLDIWMSVSTLRSARGLVTQHIRVFSDISTLKAHQRELAEQARHDSLTGLPNRRAFSERLNQAMARARRGTRALAVLFIDLDGFKAINDEHGHAAGDELLITVARRLQECVRLTDTVCRLAGDEYTVILEGAGQPDEVSVVCRRILQRLCEPHMIGGMSRVVSPSIGGAIYELGDSAEGLCDRADAAMYSAKRGGKAAYVLNEPLPMQAPAVEERQLLAVGMS